MSVLSNALTDQFEDTELDILHRGVAYGQILAPLLRA